MAVDGYLNFDTKINLKGFSKGTDDINSGLTRIKSHLGGIAAAVAAAFSIKQILAFAKSAKEAWNVQLEAETRLEQVMRNTMGATREQIQATKDWAAELQRTGVIGDEIQLSGLQELSTYLENADSLKKMNVVLNDMLAQQYGLNATAESATTISTMLGKVLEGQTSALSRYGYSFTEAQEQLLKYGTEEQRVATLAEVVEMSVGGMNEALARTPAGRLKQISNTMGDVKEQFGKATTNIQALFLPALERLASRLARIAELAVRASEAIAAVFGISLDNSAAIAGNISDSVTAQEELTEAVKETAKAQKSSIAGFDKINTLATQTAETAAGSSGGVSLPVELEETPTEKKLDKLAEKLQKLIEPIKLAWDVNEEQLTENVGRALSSVKGLISDIGKSLEEVWTNGSGERYVSNILVLFGDVFRIVGDIAEALRGAWDSKGTEFIQSFAERWNSFLEVVHTIASSFSAAWNDDGTGESIFEHILGIITKINDVFTRLREQFKKAWNENGVGERIFSTILKFIETIFGIVEKIFGAIVDWAGDLDLYPLLESISGLLEALAPLGESIGEGLAWLFENALLPFIKWLIEVGLPTLIDLLGGTAEVVNEAVEGVDWSEYKYNGVDEETGKSYYQIGSTSIVDWLDESSDAIDDFFNKNAFGRAWNNFWQGVGGAYATVQAFCQKAMRTWFNFWDKLGQTAYDRIELFKALWSKLTGWLTNIIDGDLWGTIVGWFSGLWDGITGVFSGVGEWFSEKFTGAKDGVAEAWGGVTGWFSDIWDGIKETFSGVGEWFKKRFEAAKTNITNLWNNIGKWFGDRWDDIKEHFSGAGSWFRARFEAAKTNVTELWSNIGSWFEDRWNDITEHFSGVGNWFKEHFKEAYDNVTGIFSDIGGFFSGLWEDITGGLKDGINMAIDKINSLLSRLEDGINSIVNAINDTLSIDIPSNVPVIGGFSWSANMSGVSIPHIPYLAQGTVVPANYGNFLAMLGDNKRETEIVSPLSTMQKAVREALAEYGGNDKQPITVICTLDGREIGRAAVKAVNNDKSRKGG